MSLERGDVWQERYRALFDWNVAGIILTNIDGRIVDCNEPFARIFGFGTQAEILRLSAWDFYYKRMEREILLNRFRSRGNCPAEEVCLRGRNGTPVWVLTTRSVASFANGEPELLQGTVIDITAKKRAEATIQGIRDVSSRTRDTGGNEDKMSDLSRSLTILLQRANSHLQPANLARMGKLEIREFLLVLEQMKMHMSELELLHFERSDRDTIP